jgi:dephospho-CoA kinase
MAQLIIAITGKRLSGKTTVAEHISSKYGFVALDYTRDVLFPFLMKEGSDIRRENLSHLATTMRRNSGNDILTRMICECIEEGKSYVIGGLRFPEEAEYLRSRFRGTFRLISIVCTDKLRYERAIARNDKESSGMSFEAFMEMESLPTESPIPKAMELADFTIVNEGTEQELQDKIDRAMEQIQT